MNKVVFLILCAFAAAACAQSDAARERAGANSSTAGGASLGGTGIDGTATDARRKAERENGAQGLRLPPERRKDPRDSASVGSSMRGGTDLGAEAEKEEAELRKKQRSGE